MACTMDIVSVAQWRKQAHRTGQLESATLRQGLLYSLKNRFLAIYLLYSSLPNYCSHCIVQNRLGSIWSALVDHLRLIHRRTKRDGKGNKWNNEVANKEPIRSVKMMKRLWARVLRHSKTLCRPFTVDSHSLGFWCVTQNIKWRKRHLTL